jgi:serine/threonine protein kinase
VFYSARRQEPSNRFVDTDPASGQQGSNFSNNSSQVALVGVGFEGSAAFASRNALRGGRYSFRDDLESLGYVLVYILRGWLPWLGTEERKDRGWSDEVEAVEVAVDRILQHKLATAAAGFKPITEGLPVAVVNFFHYIDSLSYGHMPDYL